jgi:predicted amidophosphoribosyltransferase
MFCAACGQRIKDGAHFCENCGASLQAPGGIAYDAPEAPSRRTRSKPQDPYKEQIVQLKLQLKQLKLYLKQVNTDLSNTRSQYYETAAFVPHGFFREGYKWFEDLKLLGPQQKKQRLQQEIMALEQQLLGLQQEQARWKAEQGR